MAILDFAGVAALEALWFYRQWPSILIIMSQKVDRKSQEVSSTAWAIINIEDEEKGYNHNSSSI